MEAISHHEQALARRILHGGGKNAPGLLESKGVSVAGEMEHLEIRDPVFLFSVERKSSSEVVAALEEAGIRVHNRTSDAYSRHTLKALGMSEGVRVSACHYNTPEEIDAFLEALEGIKQ
jgi:selenocysteine lyase/cysteine desulfurase